MKTENKPQGALLTFIIVQLCYLFVFFATFPSVLRDAVRASGMGAETVAAWIACVSMVLYCVLCLVAVVQLVLKRPSFLNYFHVSGLIGMVGNFTTFIIRQVVDGYYYWDDSSWMLFLLALFWTASWTMYFARSSRVYSYVGSDEYLRRNPLLKNVVTPEPWVEPNFMPFSTMSPQANMPRPPVAPPPVAPQPPMGHPPYNGQPYYPAQQPMGAPAPMQPQPGVQVQAQQFAPPAPMPQAQPQPQPEAPVYAPAPQPVADITPPVAPQPPQE